MLNKLWSTRFFKSLSSYTKEELLAQKYEAILKRSDISYIKKIAMCRLSRHAYEKEMSQ